MKMDEYQEQAATTAIFPEEKWLEYCSLGLASEAGEVAGIVKKIIRGDDDDDETMTLHLERREKLIGEIGDCLWYAALLATYVNIDLSVVAEKNLKKLAARKEKDLIRGDGSDR